MSSPSFRAAVEENGRALQFASSWFRDNYDIVRAAVEENWRAIGDASLRLHDNYDIVRAAVEARAIEHAFRRLYTDPHIRADNPRTPIG